MGLMKTTVVKNISVKTEGSGRLEGVRILFSYSKPTANKTKSYCGANTIL